MSHGTGGFIGFDILPVDVERLTVVAWTFSQMNVMGQLTPGVDNPYREELEQYFAVLVQAIRKRWTEEERRTRTPDTLTQREQEVAALLALGMDDNEISERLVISPATAKRHRQNISPQWDMDTEDIGKMMLEAVQRGY
jgi:FixJ family two-component response regulator